MNEDYKTDLTKCKCTMGDKVWKVLTLIEASKELPVFEYPLNLVDKEDDYWGIGSLAEFIEHSKRTQAADLSKPIIVSSGGRIMDGLHRVCRAVLDGNKSVEAVQFEDDPQPDYTV